MFTTVHNNCICPWSLVMRHVDPSRLFARAEGRTEFDEQEREHVDKCEDCKQMFEVFSGFLIDEQKGDQSLRFKR